VWRRWEDCLIFQETLETEYRRMARSKKQRLVAGRGVKKNGVYIHDQAASFESLPPGPDPNSVALDIHAYLPKLTKKATLFRASSATVEQRHREMHALIDALFSPDAPALIQELREDRVITDFFGYWRRDHDLAQKDRRSLSKSYNSMKSQPFPDTTFPPPTSVFGGGARSQKSTPRSPTFSDAPLSPTGTLAIKAIYNNAIIMLRTSREISFEELRKRLYDKFVIQEGIPLSESFFVAYTMPCYPPTISDNTRSRTNSMSSTATGDADPKRMSFITSQTEWEQVASSTSFMDKLTLHIFDTPS
jgi:hypothetical protein